MEKPAAWNISIDSSLEKVLDWRYLLSLNVCLVFISEFNDLQKRDETHDKKNWLMT